MVPLGSDLIPPSPRPRRRGRRLAPSGCAVLVMLTEDSTFAPEAPEPPSSNTHTISSLARDEGAHDVHDMYVLM